jgi:diaminohydroxyphosphoribosylaminopyrimidine deaminase / 5-amino-6-(5-phosphoribosylamino)uracil reductase
VIIGTSFLQDKPVDKFSRDEDFMRRALVVAERGRGFVSPNPMVGACVVKRDRLISVAYHERFGGAHAEVGALQAAGRRAHGATLYVTLEPCSTAGKTPPCVDAIREAGIVRVVIGTKDPNPQHDGRAAAMLRKFGIKVVGDVLGLEAKKLIRAYAKWSVTRMPLVTLKMAQSLDGKVALQTGESKWITGPEARTWVHGIRASCDAILVGKNTVLKDNPSLTARNGRASKDPWRVVLDSAGQCSPTSHVFADGGPTVLMCAENCLTRVVKKFQKTKMTIVHVKLKRNRLDLQQALRYLGSLGITSLLVEGGGEVAWSFIDRRLVDKVIWIVASKIIGGRHAKTSVEGLGVNSLNDARDVRIERVTPVGSDFIMEGYLEHTCFQESLSGKAN